MSVTLSLFAGAGAQFFDNNGNVLSGGKIYTYQAGTTTPLATYTTNSESAFHTNPIILDAAGRVPSGGEIWLTLGVGYKFVLRTSADVLIATYDNIPSSAQPPSANDADSIMYEQGYTVTAGSFVVGKIYRIATVGTTNFTLIGAVNNTVGTHFIATGVGAGTGTAELSQTVETKLRQIVSVMDFGAVGNGVADDTAAIQAALNTGSAVTAPHGSIFKITAPLTGTNVWFDGQGSDTEILVYGGIDCFQISGVCNIKNVTIKAQSNPNSTTNKGITGAIYSSYFQNVYIAFFNIGFDFTTNSYLLKVDDCTAYDCVIGFKNYSSTTSATTTVFDRCYALACGTGYFLYGVSDGELRNCAIDIGNAVDYPITNTHAIRAQYCGSLNLTTTHIEGLPNATGFVCFDLAYNAAINVIGASIDIYENALTTVLFDMLGYSSPFSRVNITGARQTPKGTMPATIRYRMRTDDAAYKLYVHSYDNSFINTNATIRVGNFGSGNVGESWITENNSLGQIGELYLLTGSSSGVLQNIPSVQATEFSSVINTNQTVTAATPVPMFNVPAGLHTLYVFVSGSGANFQSSYSIKSDGITAVATAISAGSSLTVTITGSSPPVANITSTVSGTCQWVYQTIGT
jgi:hypothetical protein